MFVRIITAVVGIAAAVGIITYGGWLFGAAVFVLGTLSWLEYVRMARKKDFHIYDIAGGGSVCLLLLFNTYVFVSHVPQFLSFPLLLGIVILTMILVAFEGLWRYCNLGQRDCSQDMAHTVFGVLYCGLLFGHVILLRGVSGPAVNVYGYTMEYGEALLWMVLVGTWASDTFAYFIGYFLGRHKFCQVSPKKTWEGAIGGFLGSMCMVVGIGMHFLYMPALDAHILGFLIAFVAPVGDLLESALKRCFDVKDSGKLLPGHGGVLDRFDSLLFTAPVAYYVLLLSNFWK